MAAMGAPDWLIAVLPNGIGVGIQTVATFIPVVAFLFLFPDVPGRQWLYGARSLCG